MSADEIAKGVEQAQEIDPLGEHVILDEGLISSEAPFTCLHHYKTLTDHETSALPEGSTVLEVSPAGASAWVKTVKIDVRLKDGSTVSYFKKVSLPFFKPLNRHK